MNDAEPDTKEDIQGNFSQSFFADPGSEYSVGIVAATHVGKTRLRNEDHFAVFRRSRNCEMLISNLPDDHVADVDDHAYGILVADGIGGAEFGDFASQLAIETTLQDAGLATSWLMKFKDLDAQQAKERVAAYVDRIQDAFRQYGQDEPGKKTMGTTLTGGYLIPPNILFVQIGDSRAYIFRDGILTQVTKDQTLAQELVDRGANEKDVRGLRHVLVNSLGSSREVSAPEIIHAELVSGDRILLCTDGLTDMVDDKLIAETLAEENLNTACDVLVDLALTAGGKDNLTIVIGEIKAI